MTKKQREDFEYLLRDLDSDETRDNNKARAGTVADALRILSARLDDLELTAEIARERRNR